MDKEFYDKYGKELDCKSCIGLQECSTNSNIPLCDKGYRRFAKDKIAELEQELAELKEKAIVPRFRIGQTLFMIPTLFNSLKHITEYELLRLTLSDIGIRYELSIKNKEKGIEPYYCASEDMFDISIFTTEQEAQDKLKEIQGNE